MALGATNIGTSLKDDGADAFVGAALPSKMGGPLTEEIIIKAAIEHFEKTDKWPTGGDRTSEIPLLPGDNWEAINAAGQRGHRNLEKGRTLSKILEPIKGQYGSKIRIVGGLISEEIIIEAAIEHFEKTRKWPTQRDKDEIPLLPGDNWEAINAAGQRGSRGLKKGRTLFQILKPVKEQYRSKIRGVPLTEGIIIEAAIEHFEKTGNWPTARDRTSEIPLLPGDNWEVISAAGHKGNRGLEKGRTLSKILEPVKAQYDLTLSNKPIPKEFRKEKEQVIPVRLGEKYIGTSVKENRSITFAKGEAFEQLAGILLLTLHSDTQVIPQFCLDVDPRSGFYGMRADFKAGDTIYEVKWGGATENIIETHNKHQKALPKDMRYELILLNENENLKLPYSRFSNLCEHSELADCLRDATTHLSSLLEEKSTEKMHLFRDYLYGVLLKGNQLTGLDRLVFLETELNGLLESSDHTGYMKGHKYALYCPLSAYFEYEGNLYSGLISPSALQKDSPDQYRIFYHFGNLIFADPMDRDLAVMCELSGPSDDYLLAEELLPDITGVIEEAVFTFPDGQEISRKNVTELSDLKGIRTFTGDYFEFGIEYLAYCGSQA